MPDNPPSSSASSTGFGGALKSKLGPLPTWAWLGIITILLLGYWLYTRNKAGASSTSSTANGPGAVGQPGVVVINQGDTDTTPAPPTGVPIPDPGPKPPKPPEGKTRQITVASDETLGDLAKQRHWSQNTLAEVESMNITAGQGKWTPDTRLKKGQEVLRPLK